MTVHHPRPDPESAMTSPVAARTGLKQETIAIVAVGLTILGTILFTTNRLESRIERVEARIDRGSGGDASRSRNLHP